MLTGVNRDLDELARKIGPTDEFNKHIHFRVFGDIHQIAGDPNAGEIHTLAITARTNMRDFKGAPDSACEFVAILIKDMERALRHSS
jgi:hypothetical protein